MTRQPRSPTRLAAALVAIALLGSACSSRSSEAEPESSGSDAAAESATAEGGSGSQPETVYPGAEWGRIDPADAGFDQARLDRLAADAEAGGSNCLVVTRHGELVAEWYWNGTDETSTQEVFSATKSYASTLVGIAQAEGKLDVEDRASEYIPEWAGTPSEDVTVENLVSNDSGRHWDFTTDYQELLTAADRTAFAVDLTQDDPPGTTWVYNNSAIQTLDAVLQEATGEEPASYAQEKLLGPIGMTRTELTKDRAGNTNMFFGLQSTCEDMARFGYLFLRNGNWDGTQVVPEEWVEAATAQPSQELNAAYGYLWWLNRRGPQADPLSGTNARRPKGQLVAGAPEEMYWALGLGGQIIQVDPGSDTVVVRLGGGDVRAAYGPRQTSMIVTEALTEP